MVFCSIRDSSRSAALLGSVALASVGSLRWVHKFFNFLPPHEIFFEALAGLRACSFGSRILVGGLVLTPFAVSMNVLAGTP
jgi:hypothetical protein